MKSILFSAMLFSIQLLSPRVASAQVTIANPNRWQNSTRPVTVVDGQNQVVIEAGTARLFLRLCPAP
jgi:hypothetical protein